MMADKESKTEEAALTPMASSAAKTPAPASTEVTKRRKRRRTRSHNSSPSPGRGFFVPGFDEGVGGKQMSLSEVMDAAKGISNMYLAHEIAVNKDFMLHDLKKEEHPMEQQVCLWPFTRSQLIFGVLFR